MLSSCKYCVVIPHRNVPELLRKCLLSIPKLPYIHVLVVDNSDLDKKAELAIVDFECGFGGLTVIEREPRNIGYIRNEALRYLRERHFSGKLVFADADDYFTLNAEACFERFKDADYDLVWFGVVGRDEQGNLASNADGIRRNMARYFEKEDEGALRYNNGWSVAKFIDFEIVVSRDLWFQEFQSCEDTLFNAKLGYYSKRIGIVPVDLYVYVQRQGSLTTAIDASKCKMGFLAAYDTTTWLKERTEDGYYWTQYNVIWHWVNWCQSDWIAWHDFRKVYKLCDKRSALRGAVTVLKRKLKSRIRKG